MALVVVHSRKRPNSEAQAGTSRVSIIGEPVGDRLMFFSDGLPIQLPHSGRFFPPDRNHVAANTSPAGSLTDLCPYS
jgi:hypothetical protein